MKIIRNTVIFIIYREFTTIFLGIDAYGGLRFSFRPLSLSVSYARGLIRLEFYTLFFLFLSFNMHVPKHLISFVIYVVVRLTIISFIILSDSRPSVALSHFALQKLCCSFEQRKKVCIFFSF